MSHNIDLVSRNIHALASKSDKACVSGLNKATTQMLAATLDDMQSQVPLSRSRMKKQVSRLQRATVERMRSGVLVKNRGVLLHNFPHRKTSGGVSVKVTNRGSFNTIKHAFIGVKPLRGSGVSGYIAMRTYKLIEMLERGRRSDAINDRIATLKRQMGRAAGRVSDQVRSTGSRDTSSTRINAGKGLISPLYSTSEGDMAKSIKSEHRLDKIASQTFADSFRLKLKG